MMATATTITTARDALVTKLNTGALAGRFFYAWPGPAELSGQTEAAWIDDIPEWTSEIPNIKAGRKQRQESYTFDIAIQVHRPGGTADDAKATFERAVALFNVIDNALADDVQLGDTSIQVAMLDDREVVLIPDPETSSWMCQIVAKVNAQARLT